MPEIKRRRRRIANNDSKLPGLAVFFIRFYKPSVAVAATVVFFLVYNIYIVDRSISDIQFALEQTAKAQSIEGMQGLDIILDAVVLKELAPKTMNSKSLVKLDFVSGVARDAEILSQTKDAKFMLSEVLEAKRKDRNAVLNVIDGINEKILKTSENVRDRIIKAALKETVVVDFEEGSFSAAKGLEVQGDLYAAIKAYEDILKTMPQYCGPEKLRLASLYQKTGNLGKARIIYEELENNSSYSESGHIARRLLEGLKNLASLQDEVNNLEARISREIQPQVLQDLYYQLGAVKGELEDFAAAAAAYKKSLEIDSQTSIGQKAKFNLGFIYKFQKKYPDSETVFRQLSDAGVKTDLGEGSNYWVADSLRSQGRYEESALKFQDVSQKISDESLASMSLFRAGYTYLYDLKDPERARLWFDQLKNKFGNLPIASYSQEKVIYDLCSVYRDEGFKLILLGKFQDATLKFAEAIRLNPTDAFSYSGFGAAKGLMKELEEAMQKSQKAVDLAPNDGYTNANLGFLYILINEYGKAEKVYEKAVALSPKYAEAQYNLGWLYQNQGQFEKAIAVYKESIKYRPNLAVVYNNLGVCYWNMDKLDEAAKFFVNAVQLDGSSAEARYNLAKAHFLLGRLKQAEAEALKATELTGNNEAVLKLFDAIRNKMQEKGQ